VKNGGNVGLLPAESFNPSLMTSKVKICRIIATRRRQRVKEGIEMPLILALIGIALDVPKEVIVGLLAIFLIRELT